jgi:hypothetical protein
MKTTDNRGKSGVALMWASSTMLVAALLLIGLSAPRFTTIFREMGVSSARIHAISYIHWSWTVPAGLGLSALLLRLSRQWSQKKIAIIYCGVAALTIALLMVYSLTALVGLFDLR